jgi:hypothetical protein
VARTFNGSSDVISLTVGGLASIGTGACTIAAIVKLGDTTDGCPLWMGSTGSADTHFLEIFGGQWNYRGTNIMAGSTADNWHLIAATKTAGTTTPRGHKYVYGTNTWTHTNAGSTLADPSGTTAFAGIGRYQTAAAEFFNGDIAVVAAWSRALADVDIEQLAHSLQAWYAAAPLAGSVLDQQAVGTPINDWTGGGANQSAITGTTVSTNSAPIGYGFRSKLSTALTAAAASFVPQSRKPRPSPMPVRRRRPTWVPPVQAAPAAPTFVPQPERLRFLRPVVPRHRQSTSVPPPVAAPPRVSRVRPVRIPRLRPRAAQPVIPTAAPVAPTYPPQAEHSRIRAVWPVRRRAGAPVPAQAAPVPPSPHGRVRLAWLTRRRSASPVPAQVAPAAPTYVADRIRRLALKAFAWHRPRVADMPIAQAWPPTSGRARLRPPRPSRGRAAQVVPSQIAPTPPTYPPQSARARARVVRPPRGRASTPVPTQAAPAAPTYVPEAFRQALRVIVRLLRGRGQPPVPAQAAPPSRGRVKVRPLAPPRRRGVQFIPAQVPPPSPPAYPPTRSRMRVWALRVAAKRPANGWLISVPDECPPPTPRPDAGTTVHTVALLTRPNGGTTARPGSGTTTYATATTARPGSGVTVRPTSTTSRPSSGTTARPGSGTTAAADTGDTARPDTGETEICD